MRAYLSFAPDLRFDAGLVDTFLHGRDRSYTVDDCLDLVASAGLVFQEWFLKTSYYPTSEGGVNTAIAALPERRCWSVMERINTRNACHFFTACRADRPAASYRIDFDPRAAAGYVPMFRYRVGLDGATIVRPGWRLALDPVERGLVGLVDGRRSIGRIVGEAAASGVLPQRPRAELDELGRRVFRSLWQRDFLAMGLER
ncbi:MAG: hypothetical protein ACKOTB_19355 [Planctomycetia bacterium]